MDITLIISSNLNNYSTNNFRFFPDFLDSRNFIFRKIPSPNPLFLVNKNSFENGHSNYCMVSYLQFYMRVVQNSNFIIHMAMVLSRLVWNVNWNFSPFGSLISWNGKKFFSRELEIVVIFLLYPFCLFVNLDNKWIPRFPYVVPNFKMH